MSRLGGGGKTKESDMGNKREQPFDLLENNKIHELDFEMKIKVSPFHSSLSHFFGGEITFSFVDLWLPSVFLAILQILTMLFFETSIFTANVDNSFFDNPIFLGKC